MNPSLSNQLHSSPSSPQVRSALPADLHAPFMPVAQRPPLVMSRGQGSYLWDEAGKCYLDLVQGWATNTLGHSAPEVLAALAEQSSLLINPSPAFYNRPAIELARLLIRLTHHSQVALLNSGAEANETAIKLARKWGQKYKRGAFGIVTTEGAFHGRTLAAMAASGKPGWDQLFPPYPPGFLKVPFGDLTAMEQAIDPGCVALMVEPIQGEAGVVVPPSGYLKGLRELADRYDLLLILDEVQTGLGRTGYFLAAEQDSVQADITTLGKGLGAGLPISAVLCNARAACFELGDNGSTHGGNPLLAQVALSICRIASEPGFLEGVRRRGATLESLLRQLAASWGRASWRGRGLLQALLLEDPIAGELSEAARDHGLLVNAARPNVLRFMPQLRINETELAELGVRLGATRAALPHGPAAQACARACARA
jgi:acetylornithine/N-succinyldiaminopimelate aminotransferase